MNPTADQIAIAIVEACRLVGGDPIAIASGVAMSEVARGRHVALASLIEVFPDATKAHLARCCGYRTPKPAASNLKTFRQQNWWNEDWVDEVVGAIIGDDEPDEEITPSQNIHFTPEERRIIIRLWKGGAGELTIGAALGSDADSIRVFAKQNPQMCPPRQGDA